MMLDRRAAMTALVAQRGDDLAIVSGLGSATWDLAAAGDDPRNVYLWGAMGGAAMVGLGLALAQPRRRIAVVTGDGEMLMGLGSLGTIGVQRPPNLAVFVFDNGLYAETGMQESHTRRAVDMVAVARGCGFQAVHDVADETALQALAGALAVLSGPLFARIRITPDEPPRVLPLRDGAVLKARVRRALGVED